MKSIRVSAPGKIVLAGEYAVLHGAHAIAAAVDRRARVILEPCDAPGVEVRAPGYRAGSVCYEVAQNCRLTPLEPSGEPVDFALFEQVWAACAPVFTGGLVVTLDTSEFVDEATGNKLGLGSSAALCVALTAALQRDVDASSVMACAGRTHHDYQQGGSGVDIASAVYGGIIDYSRETTAPVAVDLPDGLHFAVLWSGKPASTPARIRTLAMSLQQQGRHATLRRLKREADNLAVSWGRGNAQQLFSQYRRFIAALGEFDADHKLDIFSGGHAELVAAANKAGVLYKPCGAGGGDVGVAIGLDAERIDAFIACAPQHGFQLLELDLGAAGLRHDRNQHDR